MEKSGVLVEVTIYKVKDHLSPQFKLIDERVQDSNTHIWLNFVTAFCIGHGPLFS
jgi:hypothetical protein